MTTSNLPRMDFKARDVPLVAFPFTRNSWNTETCDQEESSTRTKKDLQIFLSAKRQQSLLSSSHPDESPRAHAQPCAIFLQSKLWRLSNNKCNRSQELQNLFDISNPSLQDVSMMLIHYDLVSKNKKPANHHIQESLQTEKEP